MNSFWNSNLNLFKERFSALAANLTSETSPDLILEEAKNGSMTAKSGSLMLHSKYNPEREADTLVESFDSSKHENAVFLGFGLGYGPAALAKKILRQPSYSSKRIQKDFFRHSMQWTGLRFSSIRKSS